jgi:hypothetical protein
VEVLLAWDPKVDIGAMGASAGISPERVERALMHLGAAGRVGFNLTDRTYFHRELPYDRARLDQLHPRLHAAARLLKGVTTTNDGANVSSGDVVHRVVFVEDGTDRCTCPMSMATEKSAFLAMRCPHWWPPEVRSFGHRMSAPLAEAST